jgi:hypothetical protein
MKTLRRILLTVLLASVAACTNTPEVDLEGTWHGQWSAGNTTGNLTVTFDGKRPFGDMKVYDVTMTATGPTCPTGEDRGAGDRTAAFKQDNVNFAVQMAGSADGEGVFQFNGTLMGSVEIDGTYTLTGGTCPVCACGMEGSGTWRLLR